jgi:hypothetical protein
MDKNQVKTLFYKAIEKLKICHHFKNEIQTKLSNNPIISFSAHPTLMAFVIEKKFLCDSYSTT